MHELEVGNQLGIARTSLGFAFQYCVHIGIRHARCGADNAFNDLVTLDAAFSAELHNATQYEPVFVWSQAAYIGRQFLRQHGNGAVGKVNAGAAQARFQIEVRALADVLGNVRNVDLKLVTAAIGALAYIHRIVEVLCRFAVDGDNRQPAKIRPASSFLLVKVGHGAGLG